MDIRKINDTLSVSPQICVEDVAKIKAAGFVAIVNNRPDGEEAGQPVSADIEAEAKKQGLPFHFIPVKSAPFDPEMVQKVQEVLNVYPGPVFFYCRTGTRCTNLWAISQAGKVPGKEIIKAAFDAGYDIAHLGNQLD